MKSQTCHCSVEFLHIEEIRISDALSRKKGLQTRHLLLRVAQKNQQITHFFHDTPP